jgi:hypothetical protein
MTAPRALAWDNQLHFSFNGFLEVALYDLMYHDTDNVKPASSQPDAGTEVDNQTAFAENFAGVAMSAKSTDQQSDELFPIAVQFLGEFPCEPSTWEVGDLVAVDEDFTGSALENQKLVKTQSQTTSIGYCVRRSGSIADRVRVRLFSRVAPAANPAS